MQQQEKDGSWPAEAFCLDPARQGKSYYHGSSALTTALVLEALGRAKLSTITTPRITPADEHYGATLAAATRQLQTLDVDISKAGKYMLQRLQSFQNSREIVLLPHLFAASLAEPLPLKPQFLLDLSLANVYGWMAYTIYDDFLDGLGETRLLSVANMALRQSLACFRRALPQHADYQTLVEQTFTVIDGANAWEVAHCRCAVQAGAIRLDRLPAYGRRERLAERSLGHALTPLGLLAASGFGLDNPAVFAVRLAFRQYLIARQLSDDMHDWEQDIRAGRISFVVKTTLQDLGTKPGEYSLEQLIPALQRQFWQSSLPKLCLVVRQHIQRSRSAWAASGLISASGNSMVTLLDGIEQAVDYTLAEQTKAQQFLQTMFRPGHTTPAGEVGHASGSPRNQ